MDRWQSFFFRNLSDFEEELSRWRLFLLGFWAGLKQEKCWLITIHLMWITMEYIRNNIMFMDRLKMRNSPKIEILIMKLMKTCMRFSGTNMFWQAWMVLAPNWGTNRPTEAAVLAIKPPAPNLKILQKWGYNQHGNSKVMGHNKQQRWLFPMVFT